MIRKLVVALAVCALPVSAQAALNAYLKVNGQKAQVSVTSIVSPRDPASGQATGKRAHKPFKVTLTLDKSSPLLGALKEGAALPALDLEAAKVKGAKGGKGTKADFLVVKLQDVLISSYKTGPDGAVTVEVSAAVADNLTAEPMP